MKNILISPYNLHSKILKTLRKEDPFFDVKIVTKEEILGQIYGKIDRKFVLDLMNNHNLTYQASREILSYIPYVSSSETPHLELINQIKKDVEVIKNEYINKAFENSQITVIGYSKFDKELNNALSALGLKAKYLNEIDKQERIVTTYENIEDEAYGILNKIAKLINNGEDISNIYIFSRSEEHNFFFKKYSKSFGFAVNFDFTEEYSSLESSKIFINNLRDGLSIKEAYENVSNLYQEVEEVEVLKRFLEEEIQQLPRNQMLDYIVGELKTIKLHSKKFDKAVNIVSSPVYGENMHIFMVGFNQGTIPTSFKDNTYLNDQEKNIIGLNTTMDKFMMDEDLITQFIYSKNHINISRCKHTRTQNFFPSYLMAKLGFKSVNAKFDQEIFSIDMVEYYAGKYKDLYSFYRETSPEYFGFKNLAKVPYFAYDNSFTGADVIKKNQDQIYAYSNVKTYNECPFKYYLNRVLRIDPFETNFAIKIGNVSHHIFEKQFEDDFDFEKEWEAALLNDDFSAKEKTILINLKKQIKAASEASVMHYKKYLGTKDGTKDYKNELKLKIQIDDHTFIRGNADKVVIINNNYVFVVDYKTGSETFSPKELEHGESMQLPTYALLLANSEEYKDYQLVGLYINNVIDKSLKITKGENDLISKNLRLKGVTLNDQKIITLIDNTFADGTSSFINSIGVKANKELRSDSAVISSDEFENYQQIALNFYKTNDLRIRNNDFQIKPKFFSQNKNACKYCSYKDICYVRESQREYVTEEAKEEAE